MGRPADQELARILPELAERFGPVVPASSDRDRERNLLFESVLSFVGGLAVRPLVLVLDDLHRADKATLMLLKHIVRSPEASHLLLVGTYRETTSTASTR